MGYTTNLNWLAGFLNHQQKQTHRRLDIDMHEKAQVLQPQVFFGGRLCRDINQGAIGCTPNSVPWCLLCFVGILGDYDP